METIAKNISIQIEDMNQKEFRMLGTLAQLDYMRDSYVPMKEKIKFMSKSTTAMDKNYMMVSAFDAFGYTFDENGNEIKRRGPIFPLIGVGSTLLGIILMVMPTDLIIGVTYVLGAMLIIGALSQGYNLFVARRYWDIPIVYWLLPLITLGVGILVVVKPMEAATLPLKIIGWALMFYGVVECINAIAFYQARKRYEQQQKAVVRNAPSSIDTETIEEATIVE
jgi:hypothetical protein